MLQLRKLQHSAPALYSSGSAEYGCAGALRSIRRAAVYTHMRVRTYAAVILEAPCHLLIRCVHVNTER